MAAPFPDAQLEPLIYMSLGFLLSLVMVLGAYVRRLRRELDGKTSYTETPEIDKIGLSKRAEDVLGTVIDTPMLQSKLPDELGVSKATVSNAVSELADRGLIKRKKKANTYLIEPEMEKIMEEER